MSLLHDTINITTAVFFTAVTMFAPDLAITSAASDAADMLTSEETASLVEKYDASSGIEGISGTQSDRGGTRGETTNEESEDDESLWYRSEIPMKKEHQKLLWECCKERNLDYLDMLALISLESNFNEKCSTGRYKGYFQISTIHAEKLSKTLNTANDPLDGAVNIKWGTALYSWILADERVKNLSGNEKRDVALSIYQRGSGGYDKYGINTSYLKKFYNKREIIASYFESG